MIRERRRYGYPLANLMDEFMRLRDHLDSWFNRTLYELVPSIEHEISPEMQKYTEPLMDIVEDENDIIVTMEIPGVPKDAIKIKAYENTLEVKAEKKEENQTKDKNIIRMERRYQGFYRRITLPDQVNPENAKATYKNGILTITLPKLKKKEQSKEIKIE